MRADAEPSCTESRTDSWSPDGARNPWSAPTTELWAPTRSAACQSRAVTCCGGGALRAWALSTVVVDLPQGLSNPASSASLFTAATATRRVDSLNPYADISASTSERCSSHTQRPASRPFKPCRAER